MTPFRGAHLRKRDIQGPVWFPMNMVMLRGLAQFHRYFGDRLRVECPTGSGNEMNLSEVAHGAWVVIAYARNPVGKRGR